MLCITHPVLPAWYPEHGSPSGSVADFPNNTHCQACDSALSSVQTQSTSRISESTRDSSTRHGRRSTAPRSADFPRASSYDDRAWAAAGGGDDEERILLRLSCHYTRNYYLNVYRIVSCCVKQSNIENGRRRRRDAGPAKRNGGSLYVASYHVI